MIRTLATALTCPGYVSKSALQEEVVVASAVSVDPESRNIVLKRLLKGQKAKSAVERTSFSIPDLPSIAFGLNRTTCFLYMVSIDLPQRFVSGLMLCLTRISTLS